MGVTWHLCPVCKLGNPRDKGEGAQCLNLMSHGAYWITEPPKNDPPLLSDMGNIAKPLIKKFGDKPVDVLIDVLKMEGRF